MSWTHVQHKDSATSTSVFTSNTTTGNQIIVINDCITGATSVAISPGSGTFTKIVSTTGNAACSEIWLCPNVTGGTTPTVTVTGGTGTGITSYEFSGGDTGGGTDGTNGGTSASGTAMSTGSITTTVSGDLVIKGFACGGTPNGTAESGWTEINPNANGDVSGYIIQSASGAITGTDTQSSGLWTGSIAALKAASGGTTPLNTTATFLPATVLTLVNQLAEKPVVSFLPQTVLTLATSEINNTAAAFGPQTVLTLNAQLLELATVGITPATVLTLAPTIGGNNVNATVGVNPGVQMTLNSSSIQSASVGFSPGITSLLMANFFGATTFPILLPPGNETSNLQQ